MMKKKFEVRTAKGRLLFCGVSAVVLSLAYTMHPVEEPRIGIMLRGPYMDGGEVVLEYRVTNYEDQAIQFKNHDAMNGVIRAFSGLEISYTCPDEIVEIAAQEKYDFKIPLTDFPEGSYRASFSAASGQTKGTSQKTFSLPLD